MVLPYFKSKLHSIYNKEREARLQASLWGHGEDSLDNLDYITGGEDVVVSTGTSNADRSIRIHLMKRIQKIVGACYPWIHASCEGTSPQVTLCLTS